MNARDSAEIVALRALGWMTGNEDLLPAFLGATGAGAADLRERTGDPAFLVAVLDFILQDDRWVIAFCDAEGLPYDAPMAARRALPGGEAVHWT